MSGVWQHTGPLLLIMVALAVVSMFTGCREETLDARLALVHHEPGMEEIVLMLDRSIYLVPIEEGAAEPRLLYEAAEVDPSLDAFIPLIRYDGHEMTLYTFRLSRMAGDHIQAPVTVNRFSCQLPEGDLERVTSSIREGESLELMEEALTSGTPMTPIAFTGQQLTFEHDGSWYRLTVETEGPRHNRYSYAFHIDRLDVDHAEPGMAVVGYDWLVVDERVTAWHPNAWDEDTREELKRYITEALVHLDGVFRPKYPLPVNITIGQREDQVVYQGTKGGGIVTSSAYPLQARFASLYSSGPQDWWLRHELTHGLHMHALLERGMSLPGIPKWAYEGLAVCFELAPADRVLHDYPRLARSAGLTFHEFNPVPLDDDSVKHLLTGGIHDPPSPFYALGKHMILYLADGFGFDRMIDYVLETRLHGGDDWDREDEVTREFFGMTQVEIFRAALEEPLEMPEELQPDYIVTEWQLLTDTNLNVYSPDVSSRGDRVAFGSGPSFMIMDLETAAVETVLSAGEHQLVTMGGLSWFPCGERLLFNADREGESRNLYAVQLSDPKTLEEVVVSAHADATGDVSPCGELVVFRSERAGTSQLFLKDLTTGEIEQLTDEPYSLYWPRWSPGGDRIAFERRHPDDEAQRYGFGVMDLESGEIHYHELHPPYLVWTRAEWLCNDEILVPVRLDDAHTTISLNVTSGERAVWGGMVHSLQGVVPIPGLENEFLVRVRDFPRPSDQQPEYLRWYERYYTRLMKVTMEGY